MTESADRMRATAGLGKKRGRWDMASKWREVTLGDLCDDGAAMVQTGPFGSQLHAHEYLPQGVPVVPTEAIRNRQIDWFVLPRISEERALTLSRHRLQVGDILFARRGIQATGHIGYVRQAEQGFICGTGAILLRSEKSNELDSEFLSHVLADTRSIDWFKFHAVGATMPNLNDGIIRSFRFSLPSIEEQREIAAMLSSIDHKIEVIHEANKTLEAIARAIFKSWFVDFDPVRVKAEGREPEGMDAATAALFPSEFQKSELGQIPIVWSASTVASAVYVIDCLHSKKPERLNEGRPFLQLSNIRENGIVDISEAYNISDKDYEKWISRIEASPGDCVITNVGRVGAVAQIPTGVKAALGRNMTGVRCKEHFPLATFLIELMMSDAMREEIASKTDSGTILESLNVQTGIRCKYLLQ